MHLKLIEIDSPEYAQALQLRYRLFYKVHGIAFDTIASPQEKHHQHLALVDEQTNQLLAYGQLGQNSPNEFQIYQMVVEPSYQMQGLGRRILETLVERAIAQGAIHLVLHARVTKVGFYQRSGFTAIGKVFPSPQTGVPHIKMTRTVANVA
ncbi:MAG: GNAT family N-acetyltransferase [Cyanobacteria bacterium P01_F01_bin.150]